MRTPFEKSELNKPNTTGPTWVGSKEWSVCDQVERMTGAFSNTDRHAVWAWCTHAFVWTVTRPTAALCSHRFAQITVPDHRRSIQSWEHCIRQQSTWSCGFHHSLMRVLSSSAGSFFPLPGRFHLTNHFVFDVQTFSRIEVAKFSLNEFRMIE